MAKDMLQFWHMVCLRRIESNCWEMDPQPNLQRTEDPNLRVSALWRRGLLRRWQRANLFPLPEARGPLTLVDGTVLQV